MMRLDAPLWAMLHRRATRSDGERVSIMSNGLGERGKQGTQSNETDWIVALPEGSLTLSFVSEMVIRRKMFLQFRVIIMII